MRTLLLTAVLATSLACATGVQVGPGETAPDFHGTWLNHPDTSLRALRGRVVLVEVWRSWCATCTLQVPRLNALHRAHEADGLVVVGLTSQPRDEVAAHVEEAGILYPVAVVPPQEEWKTYGALRRSSSLRSCSRSFFAVSILVDPEGRIVWEGHPTRFEAEAGALLQELLGRATDGS